MKIGYSSHALIRMRERSLSKAEVEQAFRSGRKTDGQGGSRMAVYETKERVLTVVYVVVSAQEVVIKTTYSNDITALS